MAKRLCKICRKPLADLNKKDSCFRHFSDPEKPDELQEIDLTVCSSRATPGFDRVQIDYTGGDFDYR